MGCTDARNRVVLHPALLRLALGEVGLSLQGLEVRQQLGEPLALLGSLLRQQASSVLAVISTNGAGSWLLSGPEPMPAPIPIVEERLPELFDFVRAQARLPDNRALPEILHGLDRLFGVDSSAALIAQGVLPLLETMMLVDSDARQLFDAAGKAKFRADTPAVFADLRQRVAA